MKLSELASRLKNAKSISNEAIAKLENAIAELELAQAMASKQSVIREIEQVKSFLEQNTEYVRNAQGRLSALHGKKVARIIEKRDEANGVVAEEEPEESSDDSDSSDYDSETDAGF